MLIGLENLFDEIKFTSYIITAYVPDKVCEQCGAEWIDDSNAEQLKTQIKQASSQLLKSTYKEVVHKEERDIVYRPKKEFPGVYQDYTNLLRQYREIQVSIHEANSKTVVNFFNE